MLTPPEWFRGFFLGQWRKWWQDELEYIDTGVEEHGIRDTTRGPGEERGEGMEPRGGGERERERGCVCISSIRLMEISDV